MMKPAGPRTQLRSHYERARDLEPSVQMRELVDQLENPQVILADLTEAARAIASSGLPEDGAESASACSSDDEVILLEHFYARREITVRSDEPFVFTCIRGRFDPLAPLDAAEDDEGGRAADGFDYVGLLQDRERIGVLGVVQSQSGDTPYSLLLRALSGLAEMLPDGQSERLGQNLFKGALGDQPVYDLQIVLWEESAAQMASTLGQLTRDLADVVRSSLAGQTEFTADLGSISCLTMDPGLFEGELQLSWRV